MERVEMSGTLRTTLGSAATAPRAAPSVADEEAPPPPPPFDFAGRRAWLSRADSRLGRVLGAALRDVGCHVHGVRTCGEELDFAAETFLAEPELYNPVRDDARFPRPRALVDDRSHPHPDHDTHRARSRRSPLPLPRSQRYEENKHLCMLGADVVVMTLPEDHAEVKPTVALLERAARDDLRPRALVVVSSPRAWASTTPTHPDGVLTELDEPRRLDVPGIGKASADAERLVLRAARPGMLETYVVARGVLYGCGEFRDGFLSVMRAAWEGNPVPVYGPGTNRVPLVHARELAATVTRVAALALRRGGGRLADDSGRLVVAVDDAPPATQIEAVAAIAKAFEVPLVRLPAAAATIAEGAEGSAEEDADGGADALLIDAPMRRTPIDVDVVGLSRRPAHRGGLGEPVEEEEVEEVVVVVEEEEEEEEEVVEEGVDADEKESGGDEDAAKESDGDSSPWEPAPLPVGGFPAVMDEFIAANNLAPHRVVVRGPPLSDADELAAAVAEAYSVPLLTPLTLAADWLPKCPAEIREKCGDPTYVPEPEEGENDRGDDAKDETAAETDAGEGAKDEDAEGADPEAAAAAAAAAEAERRAAATALWENLDDETRLELVRATLALNAVRRAGYVMSGGLPPDGDACRALFTAVPPRPPLRLKAKKKAGEEGADAATGADAAGADETGADAAAGATPPEEEDPPYPEETEEEAEARRALDPDAAPTAVVHLRVVDEGRWARKHRDSRPEEYEAYLEWAKAEEAALTAYDEAKKAAAEAAKERKAAVAAAKKAGEEPPPEPAEGEPDPTKPPDPPETDLVVAWLAVERGIVRHRVDASGSAFSRLRAVKRGLDAPRNFVGMIGEDGDAADPEEVAAAQEETERLRREEQRRAERKARAAQLVERQRREVAAREEDALHVRSASLRRYLATEVMPTVTDAMMQMLRLRPDDPAMALAEYLIRVDTRAEEEEEAERMANAVMERALLEEAKLREREEKLATSRRKAAEARAAIKPKSVVRVAPRGPKPRLPRMAKTPIDAEGNEGENA